MKIIPRHLAQRVERALDISRVTNIVGPRQAGKTTLVRDLIAVARYVTFDDAALLSAMAADPYAQLKILCEQRDRPHFQSFLMRCSACRR